MFNRFSSYVTFLYPLKTSENHSFSDVFREYINVTLDYNGLIVAYLESYQTTVMELFCENS